MIIIKIKTPKDYWEQLKEWVKEPRQEKCKEIVTYYVDLLEECVYHTIKDELKDKCSEELINKVKKAVSADLEMTKAKTNVVINKCYPKYNLPK